MSKQATVDLPDLGRWPDDWKKFDGEWICHDRTGRIISHGKTLGEALDEAKQYMDEPVLAHCRDWATFLG